MTTSYSVSGPPDERRVLGLLALPLDFDGGPSAWARAAGEAMAHGLAAGIGPPPLSDWLRVRSAALAPFWPRPARPARTALGSGIVRP